MEFLTLQLDGDTMVLLKKKYIVFNNERMELLFKRTDK